VQCRWKHFIEPGNTFGFKPRFVLENGSLLLLENPLNDLAKVGNIEELVDECVRTDRFYREFARTFISAPFSLSLLRTELNRTIAAAAVLGLFLGQDHAMVRRRVQRIMSHHRKAITALYEDRESLELLDAICKRFAEFAKREGTRALMIVIPQAPDLAMVREGGRHFYQPLIDIAAAHTDVIDLGESFLKQESLDELYDAGGHLSPLGNQFVATILAEWLERLRLGTRQDGRQSKGSTAVGCADPGSAPRG
jgi:hypothetical protein